MAATDLDDHEPILTGDDLTAYIAQSLADTAKALTHIAECRATLAQIRQTIGADPMKAA